MNIEETKKWLGRAKHLSKLIQRDKEEIKRLQIESTLIPSIEIKDKVQTSNTPDATFEKIIFDKVERERELAERINQRELIIQEVDRIINKLENNEAINLLSAYYFENKSIRKIAAENFSSKSKYYNIYIEAIGEISLILEKKDKMDTKGHLGLV